MYKFNVFTGTLDMVGGTIESSLADLGIVALRDNGSPYTQKKIFNWQTGGGGSMPPVRLIINGDSLSSYFTYGPYMSVAGVIRGAGTQSSTGGVTSVVNAWTTWITGRYDNFPIGSVGVYTQGGSPTGDVMGSEIAIYYIKEPGAGSFDFQWSNDGGSTWTTANNIACANATAIGAAATFSVSTSNFPTYRLRVTNVTGGAVKIIGWGIYNTNGGGVIIPDGICNQSGADLNQVVTCPTAILNPIWASIAPDLVLSCWADPAAEWEVGGNWRVMYARYKAVKSDTDFVQISRNDVQNELEITMAQEQAEIAWAREFNESYISGRAIFYGSWDAANSKGLMGDPVHPNAPGYDFFNQAVWSALRIGYVPLGRLPFFGLGIPKNVDSNLYPGWELKGSSVYSNAQAVCSNSIGAPGSVNIYKSGYTDGIGARYIFEHDSSGNLIIGYPAAPITKHVLAGQRGLRPGFDGAFLGVSGEAWSVFAKSFSGDKTITAGGTTGARTINNPIGSVNFAAAASSLVVTNSLVTANSIIIAIIQTNDSTFTSVKAVPASGSFTLYANAPATAETRVGFVVFN